MDAAGRVGEQALAGLPLVDAGTAESGRGDADVRGQLRYAIAFNNNGRTMHNLHAEAESSKWKENVLRGYMSGETSLKITKGGKQSIRVWLCNDHLVLNTIEIIKE